MVPALQDGKPIQIGAEGSDGNVKYGAKFSDIFDDKLECPSPGGNRDNHGCQARVFFFFLFFLFFRFVFSVCER